MWTPPMDNQSSPQPAKSPQAAPAEADRRSETPSPGRSAPEPDDTDEISALVGTVQEALDAAQRLRVAAMTPNQRISVATPDGRTLQGAEAILGEAVALEERAELDMAMGTLLLLVDIRTMLTEMREQVSNPPTIIDTQAQIFASAPGSIPHPGSATPEHAPELPCPIPTYHSNHLWWGPPSKDGAYQPRLFCDGVRWQPPETAGP